MAEAELVVAWGANMVSTHLHFWPYFLQARKRGGTIVCIDPVRTKTARAADIHLAPRPGSDGALALGLLHVIFAEGLEDAEFLAERTVGADELRARAMEWPVARAARATGLSADAITDLARRLAAARPAFIKLGPGAQRHADAGQAFRAILCLPAVTGAWRYAGGGAHVHSARTFPDRGAAMERPDLRPDGDPPRVVNQVQLGRALAGTYDDGGPIAALCIANTNPAVVNPDSGSVLAGLAREDLFTVVAEQFMTDTARYADVVLPATTQLEHLDVVKSWGHRYLTLNQPAIAPLGQSQPNTEIFRRIAAVMGLDHPALQDSDEALLATYLEGYDPADVDQLWERGLGQDPARGGPAAEGPAPLGGDAPPRPGPGAGRPRRAARRRPARRPDPEVPPLPQLHRRQPRPPADHGRRSRACCSPRPTPRPGTSPTASWSSSAATPAP